jgi:hypothetical protein
MVDATIQAAGRFLLGFWMRMMKKGRRKEQDKMAFLVAGLCVVDCMCHEIYEEDSKSRSRG